MYYGGERVPQNYIESYKWYALAAAQGVFWAKAALDQMQTDLLQTNRITPAQIAEGQKLAAEWKPKE